MLRRSIKESYAKAEDMFIQMNLLISQERVKCQICLRRERKLKSTITLITYIEKESYGEDVRVAGSYIHLIPQVHLDNINIRVNKPKNNPKTSRTTHHS